MIIFNLLQIGISVYHPYGKYPYRATRKCPYRTYGKTTCYLQYFNPLGNYWGGTAELCPTFGVRIGLCLSSNSVTSTAIGLRDSSACLLNFFFILSKFGHVYSTTKKLTLFLETIGAKEPSGTEL